MRRFAVIAAGLAAVAAAGCSSSNTTTPSSGGSSSTGTITVFAAASLTGAFTKLGQQFQAAHKGDTVKFSFGASCRRATQMTSVPPARTEFAGSHTNVQAVVTAGTAGNPRNV